MWDAVQGKLENLGQVLDGQEKTLDISQIDCRPSPSKSKQQKTVDGLQPSPSKQQKTLDGFLKWPSTSTSTEEGLRSPRQHEATSAGLRDQSRERRNRKH
ncbi:unnamed protein product [Urochloa humidicola]